MTEEAQGALGGPKPGDIHKPSEVPLTGQESKLPSHATTYTLVTRIWHSKSVVGTDKGSLEPSCSPAMASLEPQEEVRGRASPESYSIMTTVDPDEWSTSSREQESVEGDPAGKETLEPSVWVKSLLINMNLKSPRSPRSSRNPTLNIKSLASNPEDLNFEAQFHKLECQGSQTSRIRIEVGPPACSIRTVKLVFSFKTVPWIHFSKTVTQICSLLQTSGLSGICLVPKP